MNTAVANSGLSKLDIRNMGLITSVSYTHLTLPTILLV